MNKLFCFSAPGQPEQVEVTVLSPKLIQVTWQAPKYFGNGVIGYEVYYNKSTVAMDTTISVGDQTFGHDIRHLRPFTYYQVQVAAQSYGVTGPKSFAKVVQTMEDGKPRFARLGKLSLNFSSSSFVFRDNLLHP